MSKSKSSEVVAHPSKSVTHWNTAIYDAEQAISEKAQEIARLKRAIRAFVSMRDGGEPFPGQKEVLGQDSGL